MRQSSPSIFWKQPLDVVVLSVTACRRFLKSFLMSFWADFNEAFQRHVHFCLCARLSKACWQMGWQTCPKTCILFAALIGRGGYSTGWFFRVIPGLLLSRVYPSPPAARLHVASLPFPCFVLKLRTESGRYLMRGVERQDAELGLLRPVWLRNIDRSAVAYRQLYFLLRSSTACRTCCNNNAALKQEVTLIHTGVQRYWDFYWGQ